ncbi:helix-turn-helix domain-containing protein [Leptospira yasudae]|uniref:AraC family transcriptional regulator n=1 Tax=Leptospira yasudae TaxID=2202201 RepID=A0A6N4QUL6_9LEPT|nr:helix-turn-helix domain-containing protein [Leptospira yasudae]TGL74422.1 AraC family transcriptional regulator [Leptospira yasudae]TGL80552.1 AraC family transcriptional regulator [Leptospira yasudae]TGL84338.1 AraC family transcriptional regulator [Leptospira yasudae]
MKEGKQKLSDSDLIYVIGIVLFTGRAANFAYSFYGRKYFFTMPPHGPPHPPPGLPIPEISFTITIFSILVLWFKRHRFSFDRWFVFFLIALSCLHVAHILKRSFGRIYFDFFHIPQLLFGPLFFLYLKDILGFGVRKNDRIHFVPYLTFVVLFCVLRIVPAAEPFYDWFFGRQGWALRIATFFSLLSYCAFGFYYILKAERENGNPLFESLQFGWLKVMIGLVVGIVFYHGAGFVLNQVSHSPERPPFLPPIRGFDILAFTILFSLFGVRQSILHSAWLLGQGNAFDGIKKRKYERSGLETDRLQNYVQAVKQHMDSEKPYLDSEFSLDQLADRLQFPRAHITQALNEVLETNFYNFVNEYRVKEFIRLVDSAPEEKIAVLSLAFDAGFNSKSTFNQSFKRITGTTPSLYLSEKKQKKES